MSSEAFCIFQRCRIIMEVQSQFKVCMLLPINMLYIFPFHVRHTSNCICNDLRHKCDRNTIALHLKVIKMYSQVSGYPYIPINLFCLYIFGLYYSNKYMYSSYIIVYLGQIELYEKTNRTDNI
jgi:hypothetical protein